MYSFDPSTPGTLTDEGDFASGLSDPGAFVRIGEYFYVGETFVTEFWRYPVSGGPADVESQGNFPTAASGPTGFATDGTDLYSLIGSSSLYRLSAADLTTPANAVDVTGNATDLNGARALFYFNGDLYVVNGSRQLVRITISGNTFTTAIVSTTSLLPVPMDGATYFLTATAPATPGAPTFDNETSTGLRINWIAPDDGGDPITSYDLRYREQGTGPWTDVSNLTGTSRTITGLDSATTYEAQVRATNSVGDSAYSPSGTGTTLADSNAFSPHGCGSSVNGRG